MNKLAVFLGALAVGMFGVGIFANVMSAVCGPHNERCGGSVQLWQWLSMAAILLVPQIVAWYLTKE